MKIKQKPKFQPITITLETKEEAQAIWDAVLAYEPRSQTSQFANDMVRQLSNWFSNKAQL